MMGFLYFLKDADVSRFNAGLSAKELEQRGLNHLAKDITTTPNDAVAVAMPRSPFGPGVLLVPNVAGYAPSVTKLDQSTQTWVDCGPYLIGWVNDDPPTPESIVRKKMIEGYSVDDASKSKWNVPIARSLYGRVTIPSNLVWDRPTRSWVPKQKPEYSELADIADRCWTFWTGDGVLTVAQMADLTLSILQTNYLIGPEEINCFERFGKPTLDSVFVQLVTMVLIDNPLREEWEKKSEIPTTSPADAGSSLISGEDDQS